VNAGTETRGQPQVAYDDANLPVIVWRRDDELVATHYTSYNPAGRDLSQSVAQ
jgi:hypothetical protein